MRPYLFICVFMLARVLTFAQQPQHVFKVGMSASGSFCNSFAQQGCEVIVWSDKDTERLITAAQQSTETKLGDLDTRLKQQISALQANVKALSDANDALTKRLNDLEGKANKQQQASLPNLMLPERMEKRRACVGE